MSKIKYGLLAGLLLMAPVLMGAVDSWSGHPEVTVPFSQSVTLNTLAVVATAATGVAWNVRAITLTNSASGVVTLYNGSTNTGTAVIGQWGVIANTPLKLTEDDLGQGVITTVGTGLYLSGATGTITVTARLRKDPVSPR